jgi:DNA ligase-1
MRDFARLYAALDATTATRGKLEVLTRYFATAAPADAAWAVYFLSGGKPRQLVPTKMLRELVIEQARIPEWLFEESYQAVGDLAETIAHLLPDASGGADAPLAEWVESRLLALRGLDAPTVRERVAAYWAELDPLERFVFNKLVTGSFRVGVSKQLVVRALAEAFGLDAQRVAERLAGRWTPSAGAFLNLVAKDGEARAVGAPYPFFLAHPLQDAPDALGDRDAWQAEWKWDGIRAQLVRRGGEVFLWSRGEELVSERFPELVAAARALPEGTVLDGEVLVWREGDASPRAFATLQARLNRKSVSAKLLAEAPVAFLAYDVLEHQGEDVRALALAARRDRLETLVAAHARWPTTLSPLVAADSWAALAAARAEARARGVEGLMLKRRTSTYGIGRARGDWWKWKVDPMSVDAVLVYAQRGHGRRASVYTDYTFAVWDGDALVPFAKAYSGLTDAEFREVDAFIRRNTFEKFGPVRSVKPELVFEIGFEGIQRSARHKSGIAVRFPRMLRWRTDKRPEEADALRTLRAMLDASR